MGRGNRCQNALPSISCCRRVPLSVHCINKKRGAYIISFVHLSFFFLNKGRSFFSDYLPRKTEVPILSFLIGEHLQSLYKLSYLYSYHLFFIKTALFFQIFLLSKFVKSNTSMLNITTQSPSLICFTTFKSHDWQTPSTLINQNVYFVYKLSTSSIEVTPTWQKQVQLEIFIYFQQ